jgi:hypothetical protein
MAGFWLWEARSQDRDVKWAKAKFDHDAKAVKRDRHPVKVAVRGVSGVGALAQKIGG